MINFTLLTRTRQHTPKVFYVNTWASAFLNYMNYYCSFLMLKKQTNKLAVTCSKITAMLAAKL